MKTIWLYAYSPILFVFIVTLVSYSSYGSPRIEHLDDLSILKILSEIDRRNPGILFEANKYENPIFKIFKDINTLSADYPNIINDLFAPKRLLTIKGSFFVGSTRNISMLDPEAFEKFNIELKNYIRTINDTDDIIDRILEFRPHFEILNRLDSIFTGIGSSLPIDERNAYFSLNNLGKLEYLKKNHPTNLPNGFDYSRFNLSETTATFFYADLQNYVSKSRELDLLAFCVLIQETGVGTNFIQRINNLTPDMIDLLIDETVKKKIIDERHKWIKERLNKIYQSLTFEAPFTENKLFKSFTIKEVHLAEGLFRGCPAQDCTNGASALYALSEKERVFFIYNEKNALIGAISSSTTKIRGYPNLYIHTIGGPRISKADTLIIINIFEEAKELLGVSSISLPIESIINSLNNVDGARMGMRKLLDIEITENNNPPITQLFTDGIFRNSLREFYKSNSQTYDTMEANSQSHIVTPGFPILGSNSNILELTHSFREDQFQISNSFEKEFSFLLAVEFLFKKTGHYISLADTVANILGFAENALPRLILVIQRKGEELYNPLSLNSEDYRIKVKKQLDKYDIPVPNFIKSPLLFGKGALKSSDAFSNPKYFNESVALLIALLKEEEILFGKYLTDISDDKLNWLAKVINTNMRYIQESSEYQTFFNNELSIFIESGNNRSLSAHLLLSGTPLYLGAESLKIKIEDLIDLATSGNYYQDNLVDLDQILSIEYDRHQLLQTHNLFQNIDGISNLFKMKSQFSSDSQNLLTYYEIVKTQSKSKALEHINSIHDNSILSRVQIAEILVSARFKLQDLGVSAQDISFLHQDTIYAYTQLTNLLIETDINNLLTEYREFNKHFNSSLDERSKKFRKLHRYFLIDHFTSLNPSLEQWIKYLDINSYTDETFIFEKLITKVHSIETFFQLFSFKIFNGQFKETEAIRFLNRNLNLFFSFNPSDQQVNELIALTNNNEMTIKKIGWILDKTGKTSTIANKCSSSIL